MLYTLLNIASKKIKIIFVLFHSCIINLIFFFGYLMVMFTKFYPKNKLKISSKKIIKFIKNYKKL